MRRSKRAPWPYRALLRLYPEAFRDAFGREMEHELGASLAAAGDRRQRLRVWRHAVWDFVVSVPREHWEWIREGGRWEIRGMLENVRRAGRGLLRAPGFTTVAMLTLALGIGTTTVIFSVVHAVLLQPLPYPDAERIVSIGEVVEGTSGQVLVSYPNAQDWKAAQSTLDAIALLRFGALTLETSERAQQLSALFADGELFDIFGARPARAFTMLIKTAVGAYDVGPIREVVRQFDRGIPVFQVATMAENFAREERTSRFAAQMMAGFGAAALLLASLGVYGVLSFTVVQREREIGLRAALGAPAAHTLRHILRYGVEVAVAGVLLGGATAFGANRVLQALVPSVPDMEGRAVAMAAGALLVAAILSCLVPALRATRIAPLVALEGD